MSLTWGFRLAARPAPSQAGDPPAWFRFSSALTEVSPLDGPRRCASLPVAHRLFLPASWASDLARRREAKVPEEIVFQAKPEIALEQGLVMTDAFGARAYDVPNASMCEFLVPLDRSLPTRCAVAAAKTRAVASMSWRRASA